MAGSRNTSLRRRLLLRLVGPLLLFFLASSATCYWLAVYYADRVYDSWIYDSVNSLALLVERGANGTEVELPAATQKLLVWDATDRTYFQVRGERSGVLAGNANLPAIPRDADPYQDGYIFEANVEDHLVRIVAMEISEERVGERTWVEVAETQVKREKLAHKILLAMLIPQLLLIVAALGFVTFGINQGLRPLRDVASQLEAQSARALQPIADTGVPSEVLALTHALNDLLKRLQSVIASQRVFISDAAHQLRTPLTALMVSIERALAEPDRKSKDAALLQLRRSVQQATRLSNQLLSLARAEHDAMQRNFEPINVVELARDAGAQWVPLALDKDIEVSFESSRSDVTVNGDQTLLREAINNLLDNAIKYHPGSGHVGLTVTTADSACLIYVEDDGPGIPDVLRGSIFERFQRGQQLDVDGSGLGLAIVSEIAAVHGGKVWAREGRGARGMKMVLSVPLAA
jgi:two-component system, OmpR family, sensor histidine kinase TctE